MNRSRFNRRRFLQLAGIIGLGLPALRANRADARIASPSTRAGRWSQIGDAFRLGERFGLDFLDGALVARDAGTPGHYVSPVFEVPFEFNAVALTWTADPSRQGSPAFLLRASEDGLTWGNWRPLQPLDHHRDATQSSTVINTSGRFLQYQASLEPGPFNEPSRLLGVDVHYIDSSAGPESSLVPVTAQGSEEALAGVVRPNIVGRAGWGADERYRFDKDKEIWPVERPPVKEIIVHHTVTSNNADPAATLRAIYYYHAVTSAGAILAITTRG
jgi:hypothetical protein